MIFPIENRLNQAIAEKIEKEMKEFYPGKIEKVRVVEDKGKFFLKIVGSILEDEIENFMNTFFGEEKRMTEVKKEVQTPVVNGLGDIVGGMLGAALQSQITKATDEAMKKPVEEATQKLEKAVSDFNSKAELKLKDIDEVLEKKLNEHKEIVNQKMADLQTKDSQIERITAKMDEKLKAIGKVLGG